jgi:hypothetical protein
LRFAICPPVAAFCIKRWRRREEEEEEEEGKEH